MIRDTHHGQRCPYCKRLMDRDDIRLHATRDHVIPRSYGGTEKIICCLTCNSRKGDMLPAAWAAYMAANPGWWLLTRRERRARARAARGLGDRPDRQSSRALQGMPPMPPVIVPPELIWDAP